MSPFCLYNLKQDTPSGQSGIKKIRNREYFEGHLSRENNTFGALCMMLSRVGTAGQIHAMEKKQWKMMRAVNRAGQMKDPIGDLIDNLKGSCRRLRRGERRYENEFDYKPTDQDDSDSDSYYKFDGDSASDDDNGSDGNGSNGDEDDAIPFAGTEVVNENDGHHNEGDEIQVDAE
ncbi:hypothetical protein V865_000197 [Kwoniella europaea PYCC6329]|uniref:Uncharacterized protein n=1 Tax=Kwoniella europaea PYCC6329 TaxID=1423913 RepID=A0AAX4K8B5_9TREE